MPPAVAAELAAAASIIGPLNVGEYPFLVVRAPVDRDYVAHLLTEVNVGEAEAIALAAEVGADILLIDEAQGRRTASRLGLKTTGVLALLVLAKERGLVHRVAPLLAELDDKISFRISGELRQRILEDAGEAS